MKYLVFIFALIAAPAGAEVKKGDKVIACYCTDKTGARVELGEIICLRVDGRSFLARCEMSLNTPMWREISEGCLSSGVAPQLQGDQAASDIGQG